MHWAKKSRIVKELRRFSCAAAQELGVPPLGRITVVLHIVPRTSHRRDPENFFPTVKVIVDGLRDAHVIPDDNPDFYTASEPKIHPASKDKPCMWVEIREVGAADGQLPDPIEAA
jgi:hypothetical protein